MGTILRQVNRFGENGQVRTGGTDRGTGEGEKPRFASLAKDQLLETITLDEALNLFRLPRCSGNMKAMKWSLAVGKFGPYVRYRSKFYSLKKGLMILIRSLLKELSR